MIWSAQRLKQSLKLTPKVLSTVAVALLPLSTLLWGMEYTVSQVHQSRFTSPMDSSTTFVILFGLGAFILESLVTVSWIILITHATKKVLNNSRGNSFSFLFKHFHQTLIEYVRALISVGLYSMLLIVPGIIRWVQLSFACYICLFNDQYHKGKVDALDRSKEIVKGHFLSLILLLFFFSIIPMGFEKLAWSIGGVFGIGFFYLLSWFTTVILAIYLALTYFTLAKTKAA